MSRATSVIFSILVAGIALAGTSTSAWAVVIRPGDILVADPDFVNFGPGLNPIQPTLWKIDPSDGTREVITSKTVGGGVPLRTVSSVVIDRQGRITIGDAYNLALMRVDPTSGDRSYLSVAGDANGDPLVAVTALAVDRDDSLIVLDHGLQNILRVDPVTGQRTIISGATRGAGPLFPYTSTISVDRSRNIWTGVYAEIDDIYQSAIMKIDPTSGNRSIVSGFGVGEGPALIGDFHDILSFDANSAIVTSQGELVHIDLKSGNRSVLETDGPLISMLYTVAKGNDNTLYLGDEREGNVYRLDLPTGIYQLLSGNTPDWGPRMWMQQDMVVAVPEPGSALLFALAVAVHATTRLPRTARLRRAPPRG